MSIRVWYHGNCADGFASAWSFHTIYPNAIFTPCNHGDPIPSYDKEDSIYILDFSFSRNDLIKLRENVTKLVVLDHHITAQKDLEGLEYCKFSQTKSGAGLSWDFLYHTRSWLISYIEDRDLYSWKLPNSRYVTDAIDAYPRDFAVWDSLAKRSSESLAQEGLIINNYKSSKIKEIQSHAYRANILEYNVPVVNSAIFTSELGNILCENEPFAVVWFLTKDQKYKYSFRSRENGVDVTTIAKHYGGGGHIRASGATTEFDILK